MPRDSLADPQSPPFADDGDKAQLKRVTAAIREHDRMLVGWLARKFGDAETARDIAQEAYLRVWRFAQESKVDNPRALIFRTAANLAANEFRSRRRWRRTLNAPVEPDADGDPGVASDLPSPEQAALARSDAKASIAAIEAMPARVRRAFIMSRFEEKTYREIADALSVSVSSVEKYIIAALSELRRAVGDQPAPRDATVIPFRRETTPKSKTTRDSEGRRP